MKIRVCGVPLVFFLSMCFMGISVVSEEEYKFDPNSVPHISIQKLKNIISSGNEEVLVYFYSDFKTCRECERLLPKFHESVEYLNKLEDGKVGSYKVAMKFPEYGVNDVPKLLLFVKDIPFIYDDQGREDAWEPNDVLEWVEEAKQTPVQELTDETFEHLTQSSTGATTGDWIILFGDRSRPECLKPHLATMGTVGLRLRMRKNVAIVDTSSNPFTHERFKEILGSSCVSILFFHRTELYQVSMQDVTVSSILDFVLDGFRGVEHIEVPKVVSEKHPQFEDLAKLVGEFIEEYGRTHTMHAATLLLILFIMLCVIFFLVKKFTKKKIL